MKIFFRKIRFMNFLAYGNTWVEINLDTHLTTLIRGKNGCGKSTIIEALVFVLFNKPFRDVNKGDLVNDITGKNCLVEVEFTVGSKEYKVVRGIAPNLFEVYENGVLLNQKSDPKDYQAILEKQILRCNQKSFCQIVILGSASYIPFMRMKLPDRRAIFEDLLDLQNYTTAGSIIKSQVTQLDSDIKSVEVEKDKVEQRISLMKHSMAELRQANDDVISGFENSKLELNKMITKSTKRIANINEIIAEKVVDTDKQNLLGKNIKKYADVFGQCELKLDSLKKEIAFLTDHENCPTCKQIIDIGFKETVISKKTAKCEEITGTSQAVKKTLAEMKAEQEILQKVMADVVNLRMEIERENFQIKEWNRQLVKLDGDIKRLSEKNNMYDESEIEKLTGGLVDIGEKYNKLVNERLHQKASIALLPLIRSQVIKKYIPIFNEQIRFYLHKFEFPIVFEINEEFKETMQIRGKKDKGYGSLSEGQKYRINMALLFAWRAVARLRNSIDTNLLLLDEVMDSSLDTDGKQQFMEIISKMQKDTNVYVISHNHEQMDGFDRDIEVTMRGNFGQINITG